MIWNKKEKKENIKRADTKKQTTGYTMLLIPNSSDAAKTIEITFDRLLQLVTGAVATAIIVIGLLCSMMVHNHKLKNSLDAAQQSIGELNESNAMLESTVSSLNDQIAADKAAFSKIEDTISRKEEEEAAAKAAEEAAKAAAEAEAKAAAEAEVAAIAEAEARAAAEANAVTEPKEETSETKETETNETNDTSPVNEDASSEEKETETKTGSTETFTEGGNEDEGLSGRMD